MSEALARILDLLVALVWLWLAWRAWRYGTDFGRLGASQQTTYWPAALLFVLLALWTAGRRFIA